jgi:hypothetical protein
MYIYLSVSPLSQSMNLSLTACGSMAGITIG